MTVKPYPAYRDSGAAWLGDVPESWKVLPAKAAFAERKRPNLPGDTHLTPSQKHGVLAQSEYMALTGNKVVLNLSGSDAMRHVEPRDFISHLRSFQGGLELSRLRGKVSAAYTVLAPRSGVVASYFKHLFKSTMYVQALQTTTDQLRDGQSIRYAQFALIPIPVPPSAEQRQIADYLDAQTAKIDALIGKQERLIETLAERRQAVISHAVTKGLDPNAPMKDSGVPWLGPVPVAWTVQAIKRRGSTGAGAGFPHEFQGRVNEEIPFHKVNVLGRASPDGVIRVQSDSISRETAALLRARVFPAGSLVMAKIGAALLLGRIRILGAPACIDNNMMCIQVADTVDARFMFWALDMIQFDWLVNPGAVPSTSEGAVANYHLAFPPIVEQRKIAEYLDRETSQIDALSAKAREMIDVLKERRQALISAAVTGKIDVRGLA